MIFTGIIVSFYYFPFEFSFLPGLNTKMGLAVVGILLAILNLMEKREVKFPRNLLTLEVLAVFVSLVALVSVIINNTSDYAYATYFVSMTVWISGAYAVCSLIKKVNNNLSVDNLTVYITCVCVAQCMLALIIDSSVSVKLIVDTYILQGQEFLTEVDRLYGVGASLDTAGVRFSACLIMVVYVINKNKSQMSSVLLFISIVAYVFIAVVGNMVARTTMVGVGLSLFYALLTFRPENVSRSFFRVLRVLLMTLVLVVPLCMYLYDTNLQFYQLIRFAFEGFFNWAEKGQWEIGSNEELKTMIVFPDNFKTWLIGDAYFFNAYMDPYYLGESLTPYYMGTDIGYLRFIFYFGIIGLIVFSFFFVLTARECITMLPEFRLLILFILVLGFVIWLKVATDVFLVFALLLCVGNMQDETPQLEEEEV